MPGGYGGAAAAAAAAAAASAGVRHAGYKRNRSSGPYASKRQYGAPRAFRPGYDRTSGFYGMALAQRRARASRMNQELKFHDIDVDDSAIATTGTILNSGSVNLIAQGTEEDQRIGRKVVIKSINWRGTLVVPSSSAASTVPLGITDTVRIIMYIDKQCNGATATVTDILATANYQSFNNLSNKERFRTLFDRTFDCMPSGIGGDGTTNTAGASAQSFSFYHKCNLPIEFSATAGALTEIRSNNIGVLAISRDGSTVTLDSKVRLRFTE